MQDLKLAVLIDADNISPKYVKVILDEAASFGVATCKRIYGDWSDVRLKSWKDVLLNNSIIPIQQYGYTTGKNATDSAMIIDAMDLLYSGSVDGFCIVSSDSDFTRLAARLREAGKLVIGMGESKALGPFVKACDQFKYLDLILDHGSNEENPQDSAAPPAPPPGRRGHGRGGGRYRHQPGFHLPAGAGYDRRDGRRHRLGAHLPGGGSAHQALPRL